MFYLAINRLSSLNGVDTICEDNRLVGSRPFFFNLKKLSQILKFVLFKFICIENDVLELLKSDGTFCKKTVHYVVVKHFGMSGLAL